MYTFNFNVRLILVNLGDFGLFLDDFGQFWLISVEFVFSKIIRRPNFPSRNSKGFKNIGSNNEMKSKMKGKTKWDLSQMPQK